MKIQFWLFAAALCAATASCTGNRKLQNIQQEVSDISEQQRREAEKIRDVRLLNDTKLREKKTDSLVHEIVDMTIDNFAVEAGSRIAAIKRLDSLISDKHSLRNTSRKNIRAQLDSLIALNRDSTRRLAAFRMLEDGLNNTSYSLFKLAAFFGPGKYSIPQGKETAADSAFAPLIDSLISFSSKYPQLPKKATLVILGYADGTGFDPNSNLYVELERLMNKKNLSKQEMNKKLSDLRAQSLLRQLKKQLESKLAGNNTAGVLEVSFIGQGRGEVYPFPFINDYKEEDERRRIVLCYWTVLPV
ncbi:MAG: hypothetical protein JNM88_00885 [Chitinophagaceae bacterium]|nr:hypothetical protein [Chitinophagaceae bacterium]